MGSLVFPVNALICVDTPIFIYSVEKHPLYKEMCDPIWSEALSGNIRIIASDIVISETFVYPLKKGDRILLESYEDALYYSDVQLIPITQQILRYTAQLRADIPGLKTPDAIHAATALLSGASMFITNDPGFKRIPNLPVYVLDEI